MTTGIYRRSPFGEVEEVDQADIDFWCEQCQFPYGLEKCKEAALIQKCWHELQAIAVTLKVGSESHIWHLLHECPFVHTGQMCRCNSYANIERAFGAAGIEYRKGSE